jgi:hypothetical protein
MSPADNPAVQVIQQQVEQQRSRIDKLTRMLEIERGTLRQLEIVLDRLSKLPAPASPATVASAGPASSLLTTLPVNEPFVLAAPSIQLGLGESPRARRRECVIQLLADGQPMGPTEIAEAVSDALGEEVSPMNVTDILRSDKETFANPERGKWSLRRTRASRGQGGGDRG